MKVRKYNIILKWFAYGVLIVSLRRIIVFGFNDFLSGNWIEEYTIGILVALSFGCYYYIKKRDVLP